jgi:hypothetical protein
MEAEELYNYEQIKELQRELAYLSQKTLANMNERLIELKGHIQALDDRTKFFCPDGGKADERCWERKVENRLEKHAKTIMQLRRIVCNGTATSVKKK